MNIHFYSKTDDFEIDFIAEANILNGYIVFNDESLENTVIAMKEEMGNLHFRRSGDVEMDVIFTKGKITSGLYSNSMGLEFEFGAKTKKLNITENLVELSYDLLIDGKLNNSCDIRVEMNN